MRPSWPLYAGVMAKAVTVKVTGRVQGVSFRWYAVQEAQRLGVTGWVRNEPDGSVGAHVEGEDDSVDAMVAWCRRGPSYASVRDVAVSEAQPAGAKRFEIRY
jgi:acylphosphatase